MPDVYRTYGGSVVDLNLPLVTSVLIAAKSTTTKICVQRIVFVPTTYIASVLTFLDSLTGVKVAQITVPDSAVNQDDLWPVDFGERGTPLSAGASLVLGTTNGAVGRLHIDAYQKGR